VIIGEVSNKFHLFHRKILLFCLFLVVCNSFLFFRLTLTGFQTLLGFRLHIKKACKHRFGLHAFFNYAFDESMESMMSFERSFVLKIKQCVA